MGGPFLTLNSPKPGLAGWPVGACRDSQLLSKFKRVVIAQWAQKVWDASSGIEELLCRLERDKLRATLELLVADAEDLGSHA